MKSGVLLEELEYWRATWRQTWKIDWLIKASAELSAKDLATL